jgi:hypothetical protein
MPCVYCHRVPKARLYTLIWAWQSERERVAFKTRCCLACLDGAVELQGGPLPEDGDYVQIPTECPACHDPLLDLDVDLTHLTYWDSDGEHRPAYAHCHGCADSIRHYLVEAGEKLEDRPAQNRRRGP